jgi:type I restriction enzyme S subunit
MNNAPKIRFSPFREEWASKRFADAFTVLPNNTLSRAELSDEAGTVKNVHYGDVLIKYGEYLDAGKTDIPFIASEELAERWKNAALQDGDVVMADTAEDTTAGKCTEIGNIRSDIIVSGLHTIPLHPQFQFSDGYLGYYMNSDAFHDQLFPLMQGTKVTSISKTYLADTNVHFPSESAEQAQIAQLLYSLDQMITSQQRKCKKLIALKAACLDKMFPKAGRKVPELRFDGFTGDWEPRKLGDESIEIVAGGDVDKSLLDEHGQYPVIANALTDDGVVGYYAKDYRIKAPAVTVTGRGDVGHAKARTVSFTPVVRLLSIRSKHDVFFLENAINILNVIIESTGVPQLTVPQLSQYVIYFPPTEAEEKAIGAFFAQIDNLISLHQRKLKKLQQFKQAMMHNMFV